MLSTAEISSAGQRILRIAASLAAGHPVRLSRRGDGRAKISGNQYVSGVENVAPVPSQVHQRPRQVARPRRRTTMTLQRMDNVGIVVTDLDTAIAFFTELGLEVEGKAQVEGPWVDRTVDSTTSAETSR
jgi:hypothetical protein